MLVASYMSHYKQWWDIIYANFFFFFHLAIKNDRQNYATEDLFRKPHLQSGHILKQTNPFLKYICILRETCDKSKWRISWWAEAITCPCLLPSSNKRHPWSHDDEHYMKLYLLCCSRLPGVNILAIYNTIIYSFCLWIICSVTLLIILICD